jgi:hypothetical protein
MKRKDDLVECIRREADLWDDIEHVDLKDDFMNEYLCKEHAKYLREILNEAIWPRKLIK